MAKIVVQDFDPNILDVLTLALVQENFQVHSITSIDDNFMHTIDKHRPHVVMLDFRLQGKDAREASRLIKKKYPHLPVIALSCNADIHKTYAKNGFDDYIPKPFDLDKLYEILRKHIPDCENAESSDSLSTDPFVRCPKRQIWT